MLRWWQWILVVVLTAAAASFVIELWSPNGILDQIKSDELQRDLQTRSASEQQDAARRARREARERAAEDPSGQPSEAPR
jgi:hypothetical protein